MARVILGLTISLDGFINDQDGSVSALYADFDTLRNTETMQESIQNTGAVVIGRNAFAMADDPDTYAGNYDFQVPIFVLTHRPPKKHPQETDNLTFTFVTDGIVSAQVLKAQRFETSLQISHLEQVFAASIDAAK